MSNLTPLQAYEDVLRFAAQAGEEVLRLASHAAVPQVLRPDLLHLLKLNFLPELIDNAAAEADVLFSTFCTDLGSGYYHFDSAARFHLLHQLDPMYESDTVPRSRQVASFLLAYVNDRSRDIVANNDAIYTTYLEVERWVALAFYDPESAAQQFAMAIRESLEEKDITARFQLNGLSSALATPLAQHHTLLAYAAGLEALEDGNITHAMDLLDPLGDAEISISGVSLHAPRLILSKHLHGASKVDTPSSFVDTEDIQHDKPPSNNIKTEHFDVFLCHNSEDKREIRQIADELLRRGFKPWLDEREILPGTRWQVALEEQIGTIKAAAIFIGKSGIGPWQNMEMRAFLNEFVERACPVIPVILPAATEVPKLPILLRHLNWVDFRKSEPDPLEQLIRGITGERQSFHAGKQRKITSPPVVPELSMRGLIRFLQDNDSLMKQLMETAESATQEITDLSVRVDHAREETKALIDQLGTSEFMIGKLDATRVRQKALLESLAALRKKFETYKDDPLRRGIYAAEMSGLYLQLANTFTEETAFSLIPFSREEIKAYKDGLKEAILDTASRKKRIVVIKTAMRISRLVQSIASMLT